MVQTERNQGTFDKAVQPSTGVTGGQNKTAQCIDTSLDDRPDIVHRDADNQINSRRDDGYKARAAEKAEYLGKLNLIETIVQCGNAQANDNTAKYAHLKRVDAQNAGRCTGQVRRTKISNHGTNRGVHNEEGDDRRKCRNFLFLFRHANGNTNGEDKRQVVKYDRTGRVEHLQDCIDESAGAHNGHKPIGFQHGFIGERTADAEE